MNTLIIYMSVHGCAAKAATMIAEELDVSSSMTVSKINLETDEVPDLSGYDLVVIGGSIRIGSLQKRLKKFCERNLELLLEKKIALFICCMYEGEMAEKQLQGNFPAPLVQQAAAVGYFGGELDLDNMNAFERMIIKDIIGISVNVSLFNETAVVQFTRELIDTKEQPHTRD